MWPSIARQTPPIIEVGNFLLELLFPKMNLANHEEGMEPSPAELICCPVFESNVIQFCTLWSTSTSSKELYFFVLYAYQPKGKKEDVAEKEEVPEFIEKKIQSA